MSYEPEVVSWNITNRCNLRCEHCYLDASFLETGGNELSTDECLEVVDGLIDAGVGILILTGGEPLLREGLREVVEKAAEEMLVVLGTNGITLNGNRVNELEDMGISGVGISVDSLEPEIHDSFRGQQGAWKKAVDGIDACREKGLDFTVQSTVSEQNFGEIEELAEFAYDRGARSFNLYFLVCTGRGERLSDISPEMYNQAIEKLIDLQDSFDGMMVRAKCAPHAKRIAHETESSLLYSAGCMAAKSYCRITADGKVTPCPYMPNEAGDLSRRGFGEIWRESGLLNEMRTGDLLGRCGECGYSETCFGCRARALALEEGYMDEDPWCDYEPEGEEFVDPVWGEDAEEMLGKMPSFIRGVIKRGVEEYAKKREVDVVTRDFFIEVAKEVRGKT